MYSYFDLDFYTVDGNYWIKARSPAGEVSERFLLPFSEQEARDFVATVEESIEENQPRIDEIKKFGGKLFEAVFKKDIRAIFYASLGLVSEQRQRLPIRLHLQEAPDLAYLPWEFLYDENTEEFLGLNRQTPIIRYPDIRTFIRPLRVRLPLRILTMFSNPVDLEPLNVKKEQLKIETALSKLVEKKMLEVDYLKMSCVSELMKTLRQSQFHVFHFVGHGEFDDKLNQGMLAFEKENNEADYVSAKQLSAILKNHSSLRLVFLNSCQGAKVALTNPFAATAMTLIQHGIPSVVAMQFPIIDSTAIKFTSEFYSSIADGLSVDAAVTEGRVAIYSSEDHLEWGTPVLFMRSPDGILFKLRKPEEVLSKPEDESVRLKKPIFYILTALITGLMSVIILNISSQSRLVEIEVFAKKVGFEFPPEISALEEIPLLYSGIWTKFINIGDFQPFELTLDAPFFSHDNIEVKNPLTITPMALNARLTFSSSVFDIFLQELICDSASTVILYLDNDDLIIEIDQSSSDPYETISLGEWMNIDVQECRVTDASNEDVTEAFTEPVMIKLHDFSRHQNFLGKNGKLSTITKQKASEGAVQFIFSEYVNNLDFSKNIYQNFKAMRQSTIDSIHIKRNFPLKNIGLKAGKIGDLDFAAKPNKFLILRLLQNAEYLEVSAQARLESLKIGRSALMREMLPSYLSLPSRYPIITFLIIFFIWFLIVASPLFSELNRKYKWLAVRQ